MGPQTIWQYLIEGHHLGLDQAVLSAVIPEATFESSNGSPGLRIRATRLDISALLLETIQGRVGTRGSGGFWPVKTVFLAGGIKGPCQEVGRLVKPEKGCPGMECQQTSSRTKHREKFEKGAAQETLATESVSMDASGPAMLLRQGVLGVQPC